MNYCKLAFKVFNEHKLDFVRMALKRQKLKQMYILQRNYGEILDVEEVTILRNEIKKEEERLNKLIGGLLKYDNSRKN